MVMTTKIEKLVLAFAANVQAQADANRRGEPRVGNKHAMRYIRAFQSLRAIGDQGRDALIPLMRDSSDDVCLAAAAFLLRYRHEEADCVLHRLARGEGLVAFEAAETLKRWKEKAWQLDPP
jgi:hypothetical protein